METGRKWEPREAALGPQLSHSSHLHPMRPCFLQPPWPLVTNTDARCSRNTAGFGAQFHSPPSTLSGPVPPRTTAAPQEGAGKRPRDNACGVFSASEVTRAPRASPGPKLSGPSSGPRRGCCSGKGATRDKPFTWLMRAE